ncbi:MAG TPA: hypothetical protein VM390_12920 [Acidimicrobiales bacterium]|nr:hypothetical protein [Acidimicrobiales bacterium]
MALLSPDRTTPARAAGDRAAVLPLVLAVLVVAAFGGWRTIGNVTAAPEPSAAAIEDVMGSLGLSDPAGLEATDPAAAATSPSTVAPPALLAPAGAPAKWLPSGKGMWIYLPDKTEGGNVDAIVTKAKATGLTHLWVRMGSAWDGFNVVPFVNRLLPAAHAAGIKVIGWDFPKLEPWEKDVERALTMIRHTTPSGHRIDAFSADIETRAEGTRITAESARSYGAALRAGVGPDYPLIATVPRPSKERASFPYDAVVADYDAIAPMVYWLNRQPDTDVAGALRDLAHFGKPVYPIGQAYDGFPEGGRRGVPPPEELHRFITTAAKHGAAGISFWSWQAANQPAWDAIREAVEFRAADQPGLAADAFSR